MLVTIGTLLIATCVDTVSARTATVNATAFADVVLVIIHV
jgi:hypothetical protein